MTNQQLICQLLFIVGGFFAMNILFVVAIWIVALWKSRRRNQP